MAEEGSTLKLIMEKGPREGETLEFPPGSTFQIGRGRGRVLRNGKLPINDDGISTSHLSIESTESGEWLVTDIGSSNGTVLNCSDLTPKIPSHLGNGDVIKIGEYTSIKVTIEAADHGGGRASRLRRNPRRGGGSKANLASIGEDSEVGLGFGGELGKPVENPRRRGRPMKEKVVEIDPRESLCNVYDVGEYDNVGPSGTKQGRQLSTRITRSSKKKENSNPEVKILDQAADKKTRGGRSRKKILQDEPLESVKNEILDEKEENEREKVGKDSKNKENSSVGGNGCQEVEISGQIVGKMTEEEGTRRKRNLQGEPLESVENEVLDEKGDEECERVEESLLNEQSEAARGEVGEAGGLDLEKMTLDEWFDYLEVYLPKHIRDETEEMILQMNQMAQRVQQFILEQKTAKEKGKLPLS
ncbi:hypothetical protein RHSIM_Rhsim04G0155000 [Rhododendron simsii]|uniref:FHA domain-containing protein n=1 Tax=Rhododendron simsii TaxID=118357 RepID=A0A834LME8_RHOSS|nr:hypothetical protein RHSIM_Rhsim04G0155000 [Rhododendron simsii]